MTRLLIVGGGNRVLPKSPATSTFAGWFATARGAAETVGVVDPDPAARARAEAAGARTFADLASALAAARPEAVLVASPARDHAASIAASIAAGCDVLVEKPLVADLAEAPPLLEAARRGGRLLAAVQNWRAKPAGAALRRALADGAIGRVGYVLYRYVRDRERPGLPEYLFRERAAVLFAMGIHHLDLARWALGTRYVAVEARGCRPPYTRYDSPSVLACLLETEAGPPVWYTATFASRGAVLPQESLLVEGETGSLVCESDWLEPPLLLGRRGAAPVDLAADAPRGVREGYDAADRAILEDFLEAVRSRRLPLCPAEDSLLSLAAVEAAARAVETGRRVETAEVLRAAGLEAIAA